MPSRDCSCGKCQTVKHPAGKRGTYAGYTTNRCRCCACAAWKSDANQRAYANRKAGHQTGTLERRPPAPAAPPPAREPARWPETPAVRPTVTYPIAQRQAPAPAARSSARTAAAGSADIGTRDGAAARLRARERLRTAARRHLPTAAQIDADEISRAIAARCAEFGIDPAEFHALADKLPRTDGRRGSSPAERLFLLNWLSSDPAISAAFRARRGVTPSQELALRDPERQRPAPASTRQRGKGYVSRPGLADPASIGRQARGLMTPREPLHVPREPLRRPTMTGRSVTSTRDRP